MELFVLWRVDLDAEGLRYYLPALMLTTLDRYEAGSMRVIGTIGALNPRGAYGESRFALLSESQRRVIALFLQSLPLLVDLWEEDAKDVSCSLQEYWKGYLGNS